MLLRKLYMYFVSYTNSLITDTHRTLRGALVGIYFVILLQAWQFYVSYAIVTTYFYITLWGIWFADERRYGSCVGLVVLIHTASAASKNGKWSSEMLRRSSNLVLWGASLKWWNSHRSGRRRRTYERSSLDFPSASSRGQDLKMKAWSFAKSQKTSRPCGLQ